MRPVVTMKAALTIDGQLAAADGTSQWITSHEARLDAHRRRAENDAVMVGAGTVLADDPRLDVRVDGYQGPQPRPVVVAGRRPLPAAAQVLQRNPIVLAPHATDAPGQVVLAPAPVAGRVDLAYGLQMLHGLGVGRLLVEGGAGLLASLLEHDLIDRGVIYYGQRLAGGVGRPLFGSEWATLTDARQVSITDTRLVGGDVRIEFLFVRA